MRKFRLLAGMHVQADRSKPLLGPDGRPSGRFASKTYKAGDVVESEQDLVSLHGPQHFEALGGQAEADAHRIAQLESELSKLKAHQQGGADSAGGLRTPGDPTPQNLIENPAKAPGGQVSTGFQGGAPEGVKQAAAEAQEGGVGGSNRDGDLQGKSVEDLKAIAKAEGMDLRKLQGKSPSEMVQAIKIHRDEDDNA